MDYKQSKGIDETKPKQTLGIDCKTEVIIAACLILSFLIVKIKRRNYQDLKGMGAKGRGDPMSFDAGYWYSGDRHDLGTYILTV